MLWKSDKVNQFASPLIEKIINVGIDGIGILPAAKILAADYLKKSDNVDEAIDALIGGQKIYAGSAGFMSSLGGLPLLPVTFPASLFASYALATNTVAAIAYLRGYDLECHQVKTAIILCLLGSEAEELLKSTGIQISNKSFSNLIQKIPGKVLHEINHKVGFRLITKSGETGIINLAKTLPVISGLIGGTIEVIFISTCAKMAKKYFT